MLSVALKEFSITGSKMQNQIFEENKVLSVFFRIEVQLISNPSSRLEETPYFSLFAYELFFIIFS